MTADTAHRFTHTCGEAYFNAIPGSTETEAFTCPCERPTLPTWQLWTLRQYGCAAGLCVVVLAVVAAGMWLGVASHG